MTDKRFFWLVAASLLAMVIMAFLGAVFESVNLLFNVLLAVIGVFAGYLTNSYFAKKGEEHSLGLYASAGHRLSVDIHDSVSEIIENTEELKVRVADEGRLSKKNVQLMLEIISEKLKVLQRMSLSANIQWQDVMPSEQLRTFDISEDRRVRIIEERHVLQKPTPQSDN